MAINKDQFLNDETKSVLWRIVLDYKKKRGAALAKTGLDREKFREEIFRIKKNAIAQIENLKNKAIAALKENNINVFEAADPESAREIIKKIINDKNKIAKAKSNAFLEIDGEKFLSDKEVIETDLGDFIIQALDEKESHPVLPALHLTPERIAEKLSEKFQTKIEAEPKKIVAFIRNHLREKICQAEVGISGANAVTADGKILILENEGNISLVSRLPETHIVVSGFEKILPDIEDALKIVRAAGIWGTGQEFPAYVSIISGPSKTADIQNQTIIGAQGAKEVNLILIDNGRSELLKAGFGELLYCLNCGACLNFCPVYHQIGRNYGAKYLGSKGIIFSGFSESFKKAKQANCFACALCSACFENCPAKINLPELMKKLRNYLEKENLQTEANEKMINNIKKFGNPFGEIKKGETPTNLFCC